MVSKLNLSVLRILIQLVISNHLAKRHNCQKRKQPSTLTRTHDYISIRLKIARYGWQQLELRFRLICAFNFSICEHTNTPGIWKITTVISQT